MKLFYFTTIFLFLFLLAPAQQIDCYDGRYKSHIFTDYEVDLNNFYARKIKSDGFPQDLLYDVYTPKGDTETERAVVVLAHGGGFIDLLDQRSPDIVRMAQDLVLRGYVVISMEYREEPSPLSLLFEENMVKALARALIDIRDATCHLMDTTINHGNPYGVNPEKVIIGGVSAGAVSFLHAVFLDSIDWVPQKYKEWILEVEPNTQALLDNKYCGAKVLGLVNVSGAILDTNWIREDYKEEYPAFLHVHGTVDKIVPYDIDRPFQIPFLPKLMGSKPIHEKLEQIGVRSELDAWIGLDHVPFLGLHLELLFSDNPIDFIFRPYVLNPTLEHIAEFSYSLIDCVERTSVTTSINENKANLLAIYPNPNYGQFQINLPNNQLNGQLKIFNAQGAVVYNSPILNNQSMLQVDSYFAKGNYTVFIEYDGPVSNKHFLAQMMIQ